MKKKKTSMLAYFLPFLLIPLMILYVETDGFGRFSSERPADCLTLTVRYPDLDAAFEIGKDIEVATDPDFTTLLKMESCRPDGDSYIYSFYTDNINRLKTVYVKPPILYMPTEITPVSLPLIPGQTATLSYDGREEDWFTVEAVSPEDSAIHVTIQGIGSHLPRLPKLETAAGQVGGTADLTLREDGTFASGVFSFQLADPSGASVADATLTLCEALLATTPERLDITPDSPSISVVISDSK